MINAFSFLKMRVMFLKESMFPNEERLIQAFCHELGHFITNSRNEDAANIHADRLRETGRLIAAFC